MEQKRETERRREKIRNQRGEERNQSMLESFSIVGFGRVQVTNLMAPVG